MYGGKFAFQSRFGQPYSWKEIYRFSLFCFVFEGNFQVQAPGGWRAGGLYLEGRFNGGFLRYEFGGLLLDPFLAVEPEPKDILGGARSPEFSSLIIRVPRLH